MDTFMHAWGSIAALLETSITEGIICDIGMPVMHRNVSYNCRVILLNRRVIGIRPKIYLANDGNYREMRWFTPWFIDPTTPGFGPLQDFTLPPNIMALNGQKTCPIGIFAISTLDTTLAFETCEELFTPNSPHIRQVSYPMFPPYVTPPPLITGICLVLQPLSRRDRAHRKWLGVAPPVAKVGQAPRARQGCHLKGGRHLPLREPGKSHTSHTPTLRVCNAPFPPPHC